MNTFSGQTVELEQFYYGKWWQDGLEKSDFVVTAHSPGLPLSTAERLFSAATLGSFNRKDLARLEHGYALLQADAETYLLLHVRRGPRLARGYDYPDYRCIAVPAPAIEHLAGNLQPLWKLFDTDDHLPELASSDRPLPTVPLTLEQAPISLEIQWLQPIFQEFDGKPDLLAQLLSALIAKHPVAVLDAPPNPAWRWEMCQALLLLLPPLLRQQWTFATEVFDSSGCPALLKFLYKDPYVRATGEDFQYRWQDRELRPRLQVVHPYAQFVTQHQREGAAWLIETLHDEAATTIVDRLRGCPRQDVLAILADRLTVLPSIRQGKAQYLNWATIERLLTKQLDQVSQLAPVVVEWLIDDMKMIMHQLTQQGLGDKVYQFLENQLRSPGLDRQKWRSTLEWIALEYLSQQQEEADLLDFVDQVQQTQEDLSHEFWNELIDRLRPICDKSSRMTQALLNLWLAHETTADYKDFLLDANTTAQFPDNLAALRRYWLDPTREAEERSVSLVAISQALPHSAPRFFLDMVQQAITRQTLALVDKNALHYLAELVQQLEHKSQVLNLIDQLLAAKEQLDEEVLTKLPQLLIALSQIDQAVDLVADLAQSPSRQDLLPGLVGDICRTVSLPQSLEFLQKLQLAPLPNDLIAQGCLDTLGHSDWNNIQTATSAKIGQLKQLAETYVAFVLGQPGSWSEKAQKLDRLVHTPAVIHGRDLLPHMADLVNQSALAEPEPEQIFEMNNAYRKYCPDLHKWTRLAMLASLVETFGSHRVEGIANHMAKTVQILENLESIAKFWDSYAKELDGQLHTLPPEQQEQFLQNCNYFLALLHAPRETGSDPVGAFTKLLNTIWHQLKSTPTSKEPVETNPWKKWVNKLRDR